VFLFKFINQTFCSVIKLNQKTNENPYESRTVYGFLKLDKKSKVCNFCPAFVNAQRNLEFWELLSSHRVEKFLESRETTPWNCFFVKKGKDNMHFCATNNEKIVNEEV
jgi:aldehyde:ferredoxin oxidoreductase